eukprot:Skav222168  [mRNA]  locus=scaffold3048:150542:161678:- [translate_table: standard]
MEIPQIDSCARSLSNRSGLVAMRNKKFEYKMYFGGPNDPGTKWNGYESYWNNGTAALGQDEALYNVGGGQWHHEMQFSDPYFGSTQDMVSIYNTQLGKNPTYDGAACMAAGIAVSFGLQKYGQSLINMTVAQRREEVRISVGTLNDETLYGMVRFNRFNQNNGRLTVNWQVLENGGSRPVLPPEAAATQFRFPSPTWDARLGCPAGTYADGVLPVPTQCTPCPEGRFRNEPSPGLNFSQCELCPMGYGTLPGQTGLLECPACPAGRILGRADSFQAPLQAAGYAAGAPEYADGAPSFVVECSSVVTCPGALELGKCPASNLGVACVDCPADFYEDWGKFGELVDNGLCYPCSEAGFALAPLLIALVTIGAGLALATLQALSAFSKVEVEWVEPLQTLRSVFAFLIFDISILRLKPCSISASINSRL